jgi:hypothetical protein
MALPSRKTQIEAIAKLLDDEEREDLPLDDFAKLIVDGYHDLLQKDIKAGSPPLHEGAMFKSPFTTKVHEIRWLGGERAWIVTADSRYGWFGPIDSPFWQYTEETRSKPFAPNEDWAVGEEVSRNQRIYQGTIIATGPKCVLIESRKTGNISVDSNDNMKKHYRREG